MGFFIFFFFNLVIKIHIRRFFPSRVSSRRCEENDGYVKIGKVNKKVVKIVRIFTTMVK